MSNPMPLSDRDAAELQHECLCNLADAITATATNWLSVRPERHGEREHLVGLLTDLICEGAANPDFVHRHVAASEAMFDPSEYADAAERYELLHGARP